MEFKKCSCGRESLVLPQEIIAGKCFNCQRKGASIATYLQPRGPVKGDPTWENNGKVISFGKPAKPAKPKKCPHCKNGELEYEEEIDRLRWLLERRYITA